MKLVLVVAVLVGAVLAVLGLRSVLPRLFEVLDAAVMDACDPFHEVHF